MTDTRAGFIHTEFDYAWTIPKAYPYTHPKAYFAETRTIHGTIHHMPSALKCDKLPFRPDFDYSPYDIVVMFLQGGRPNKDIDYLRQIKSKYPHTLLVWWWGEIYRFDQDPRLWFQHVLINEREMMEIVDVLTCGFHKYETDLAPIFKELFNKEYRTLYEPYDTEDINANHSKTIRDINKGILTMVHGRNPDISRSLVVMERLQKNHPDLKCYVHLYNAYSNPAERDKVMEVRNKVAPSLKFELSRPLQPHDAFMDFMKDLFFIIDDYPAYAGSNLSCVAGCTGTPSISHEYNTSAYLCFPELNFGLDEIDKWTEVGEKLISDEDFYWKVSKTAQKMAQKYYSYDAVKKQVEKIYEEFKHV